MTGLYVVGFSLIASAAIGAISRIIADDIQKLDYFKCMVVTGVMGLVGLACVLLSSLFDLTNIYLDMRIIP